MPRRRVVVRNVGQIDPPVKEWSITSNEYRIGVAVLFAALIGILTWLGNGIITGQEDIRSELQEGNANITSLRGDVMALRGELTRLDTTQKNETQRVEGLVRDLDARLSRTNERQVDQDRIITRMETLMSTLKK